MKNAIFEIIKKSTDRFSLCAELINKYKLKNVLELGVYKGDFAMKILSNCQCIENYLMIDPWRNLPDWNKPANKDDDSFNSFYLETLTKTDFAKEKRKVFKGKTTEVINNIKDNELDIAYIDGDHTLKGITIDLIKIWPKIKKSGFIMGDDFLPSIWQHNKTFEPTFIFPYAVYFAEAVNARIYGLPFGQFLISKEFDDFKFLDLTNNMYSDLGLRTQFYNDSK